MVRPRQRKTIEELYGNKLEAPKSQVTSGNNSNSKNGRLTERDLGYIITSNTPYSNSGAPQPPSSAYNMGKETSRRKSARPSKISADKNLSEKETFDMRDTKKELNMKMKISRDENSGNVGDRYFASDNKSYIEYHNRRHKDTHAAGDSKPQQQHHHPHNYHHNHNTDHRHNAQHDEDKDDDAEEFFQLIRQTVESAIGKSISELLNRNFRELSAKVDRFSAELKNTNILLNKMQADMNTKIVHYGEENSRHFRYLCMKSEYDKMFYQHQTMIAAAPIPATVTVNPQKPEKRKSLPKINIPKQHDTDKSSLEPPCSCRSNSSKTLPTTDVKEPQKISSGEISRKSSETSMKEIFQQIQKFYKQMNLDDIKGDQPGFSGGNHKFAALDQDELLNIDKEILAQNDISTSDSSSDDETPRSDNHRTPKYGAMTRRTSSRGLNNCGGGDS